MVVAEQPETGFRSGLDAVMLAAAIPARSGETVLELGAGAGTASLCLMARVPGLDLTGVEIDPALIALANGNAATNGTPEARFAAADIFALPPELKRDYAQVFCNPPFHGEGHAPPDAARARALKEGEAGRQFVDWLRVGLQRTVSGGFFTAILRADRLDEALTVLGGQGAAIFPLWPRAGAAAKRVIVQVRKASRAPLVLLPGLVLHRESGAWTEEADAVLRRGMALALAYPRL